MNLEQEIQTMYDEYPSLFQERWQCLDQLFCVIGDGYEWVNGQLIEPFMHSPKTGRYIKKRGEYLKFKGQLGEDGKAVQRNKNVKTWRKSDKREFYPLSKNYSYLFNYPKNIKQDWLQGIEETKKLLLEEGIDINNITE